LQSRREIVAIPGGHFACYTNAQGFSGAIATHVRPLLRRRLRLAERAVRMAGLAERPDDAQRRVAAPVRLQRELRHA
jgi:hypothetical protein